MQLTSQVVCSEEREGQGCLDTTLAELRCRLARPLAMGDRQWQHLIELSRRLAQVQALGGGFTGISFSQEALDALAVAREQ